MSALHRTTKAEPDAVVPGAVTHGTSADTSFIDLVTAEEDWVRREFDELIAAGWDGFPPNRNTSNAAHEPRRTGPRSRPTHDRPAYDAPARAQWRRPSRGPPG